MLFLVHYEVEPKLRDTEQARYRAMGEGLPADVKLLGHWVSVTQLEGWVLLETSNSGALTNSLHSWTDLNVNHVTPVVTIDELMAQLSG